MLKWRRERVEIKLNSGPVRFWGESANHETEPRRTKHRVSVLPQPVPRPSFSLSLIEHIVPVYTTLISPFFFENVRLPPAFGVLKLLLGTGQRRDDQVRYLPASRGGPAVMCNEQHRIPFL